MNRRIGGFFGAENNFQFGTGSGLPAHLQSLPRFAYARHALAVVADHFSPKTIHVPFLICDTALKPFIEKKIEVQFWPLNEKLEFQKKPVVGAHDLILYVNYFGMKNLYCQKLVRTFKHRVIIDNTQALFSPPLSGCQSVYSARKFVGVSDGAFLAATFTIEEQTYPRQKGPKPAYLFKGKNNQPDLQYESYTQNEKSIPSEVNQISKRSEAALQKMNFQEIGQIRIRNFRTLKEILRLKTIECNLSDKDTVPFALPVSMATSADRSRLYANRIFIPVFWPEVLSRPARRGMFDLEKKIVKNLWALPVDHRMDNKDCQLLASEIQQLRL
jgi:hypothetical protein